jgi:purine-binding chemotaxis protein CheW
MKKIKSAADFMPTSSEDIKILDARALKLAEKVVEEISSAAIASFIRFRLDQHSLFGIAYEYIKEVIQDFNITPLPMVPLYIAGVTNYRGYLLPIISLNALFNIKPNEHTLNYIIVVYINKISVGIMVSYIDGSEHFSNNYLEAPLAIESNIKQIYIQGLHNGTTAILNVDKIISFCQEQLNSTSAMR